MSFQVGQQVVCIATEWIGANGWISTKFPATNAVYTVREIVALSRGIGLLLCEIKNAVQWCDDDGDKIVFCEPAFNIHAFRPLIERKLPAELAALLDLKNHKPLPEDVREPVRSAA